MTVLTSLLTARRTRLALLVLVAFCALYTLLSTPPPPAVTHFNEHVEGLFVPAPRPAGEGGEGEQIAEQQDPVRQEVPAKVEESTGRVGSSPAKVGSSPAKAGSPPARVDSSPSSVKLPYRKWRGWRHVEHFFVFGDSYTDGAFDINGKQPDAQWPFGNCRDCKNTVVKGPYPDCIPKKWPMFLTWTYNASRIQTYNLAVGGATIDPKVVPPHWYTATPFSNQVNNKFLKRYSPATSSIPWNATNSLFAVMFGINDVLLRAPRGQDAPIADLMASYKASVLRLYKAGARNFLLLATPPLDLTEEFDALAGRDKKKLIAAREKANIQRLNAAHATVCAELRRDKPDATVFRFDAEQLYRDAMADVGRFEQTSRIRDVHVLRKNCELTKDGKPQKNRKNCDRPKDEFFWTGLHPTYAIQNATAGVIVRDCFGGGAWVGEAEGKVPGGYCSWGEDSSASLQASGGGGKKKLSEDKAVVVGGVTKFVDGKPVNP